MCDDDGSGGAGGDGGGGEGDCNGDSMVVVVMLQPGLIYKDNYRRLSMIGRERANRALIGCDSQ